MLLTHIAESRESPINILHCVIPQLSTPSWWICLSVLSLCNCLLVFECDKRTVLPLLFLGRFYIFIFYYEHLRRNFFSVFTKTCLWLVEVIVRIYLGIYCSLFGITYLSLIIGLFLFAGLVSKECRDGIPSTSSDVVNLFAVFFSWAGGDREGRRKIHQNWCVLCLDDNWVDWIELRAKWDVNDKDAILFVSFRIIGWGQSQDCWSSMP